jgi:DNA-binding NtrC family response regulator
MLADILIVDDDRLIAQTLAQQLGVLGYRATAVHDGASARQALPQKEFSLALLDLNLPDTTGLELLRSWQQSAPQLPVVMISGAATIPQAVEALKIGAVDFLVKPVDVDLLEAVIKRTLTAQELKRENTRLKQLSRGDEVEFLGVSAAVKSLLDEARKMARSDQAILLQGETGTGKQVLARYLHAQSERAGEPFVSVNCAAITETLFESELFGHEKGAFTGAFTRKPGKLELVGRGTLFLDEIGELPPHCQAKLLTAVEDRVFERVGGTATQRFEGRVIAATNRDLEADMKTGAFRRDLFYRLGALILRLPPLRERPEDVPVYIEAMMARLSRKYHRAVQSPEADTLEQLKKYPWPGNVRELFHHVERIVLLSEKTEIPRSLWLSFPGAQSAVQDAVGDDLRDAAENFKKKHILNVVARCGGNQTEAAKRLGIERTHLNRLLAEYEGRR